MKKHSLTCLILHRSSGAYGRKFNAFAKLSGIPHKETHTSLCVGGYHTHLTYEGVDFDDDYDWLEDESVSRVYTFPFEYHECALDRACVMHEARTRIHNQDLIRIGCGMPPHGLVCTTFCLSLLCDVGAGFDVWMPDDVFNRVQELFPDGESFTQV